MKTMKKAGEGKSGTDGGEVASCALSAPGQRVAGATRAESSLRVVGAGAEASSPRARRSRATGRQGTAGRRAAATGSVVARVAGKLAARREGRSAPRIGSFMEFLLEHARVKCGAGYVPFHFAGREALREIVERVDEILGSGEADASLAICGGAQFGKTVLMLNLLAYLVAVRFRNVGYYLPDDDLVEGLVDGKLRPDVLDQIPWLARLIAVGKTLTASGRATNRKGAFLCTDGERTALAFMRGLGKVPTSFSMDVVVQDEKDDLPEEHARFLAGRMTASNLRLSLVIGTQRYHGAGQNLAFTEGTQHVGLVRCVGCGARVNPESAWPGVCRLVVEGRPSSGWPRLTREGNFELRAESAERGGEVSTGGHRPPLQQTIAYEPGQKYALCCPGCGGLLDRERPEWHAEAPERVKLRQWSYRVSQLLIPAIELEQIVAAWQRAVRDAEQMTVFCTDQLALPKATTQTLSPGVLEGARGDYRLEVGRKNVELGGSDSIRSAFSVLGGNFVRYGGLDLGDQCWFVARAVDVRAPHNVRLLWVEAMAAERVRARVPELFRMLGLRALCVDAGPLRDLARDLVFGLNGADGTNATRRTNGTGRIAAGEGSAVSSCALRAPGQRVVRATEGAQWHEGTQRWRNVRAMAVEFTQREGGGLRHKLGLTQEGRRYPLLAANRDETIERVVQELLPPGVGDGRLVEHADGTAAAAPTQRFFLPAKTEETREVLDLYERHLLAGARQEREGKGRHYLDKCENHFLLATAYAALAELVAPVVEEGPALVMPMFGRVAARERVLIG